MMKILFICLFISANVFAQSTTVKLWDGTEIATVRDTGSSDSLNVAIVDASGNQVTSFGDGTEYTEDAASVANPIGGQLMSRRKDTLSSLEVSADGDVIAVNSTSKGELYVKQTDAVAVTQSGTWDEVGINDSGNSITVDGTVASTQSGTWSLTDISGTVSLPTGASTAANQSTQITSLELLDDAIVADDAAFTPATTKTMMSGFEFDDTTPDSVNEGDAGAVRMSANRNLYSTIRDAAGNERGVNVNASNQMSVSVDNTVTVGSHAVTNAGTFAVQAAQFGTWDEVGINDSGNAITVDNATASSLKTQIFGDDTTQAIDTDAAGQLQVDVLTLPSVTIGTFPDNEPINIAQMNGVTVSMGSGVNGTGVNRVTIATDDEINDDIDASTTALQIMDDWDNAASDGASVSGDVAHDIADAGEPVKTGFKAVAVGSTPTEVTANDRSQTYGIRAGIPFALNGHMNHLMASENITDADGAQTNAALVTVSAGTKIIVTWYKVKCDQDNTGDYDFRMGFGTASTPALDNDGDTIADEPGIAPGSGVVSGQIFAIGGDDEDLRFNIDDPAGGACSITVNYFTTSS